MKPTSLYPRLCVLLSLTVVHVGAVRHTLAQAPVLHWDFDEPEGNIAFDTGTGVPADAMLLSTASRTGTTPGGFSPGALDLSAEGLDSWVDAGDVAKVDTLEQFTISTWIYLSGLNADHGGNGNVRLLAKQAPGPNYEGFSWNLNAPTEGERTADNFRMGMFIGGDGGFSFGQSSENLGADNRWTFVAVSYDGTSDVENLTFYVGDEQNEVRVLGDPLDLFSGPLSSSSGLASLAVGYTDAATDIDFSLNGYQDDIRIYDSVLTLADLDRVRLENLEADLLGDFNGNGSLDANDIDLLTAEIRAGTHTAARDVTGDGLVDGEDLELWVDQLRGTWFGDANLDGEFNSGDLVQVFQRGEFEDSSSLNSTWESGDWNGDGDFDSSDFVRAFQGGGFEQGPRAAIASVPEPTTLLPGLAVLLLWCRRRQPA